MQRRRFKHTAPLKDNLASLVQELREQAASLPPGPKRDALLRQARRMDTASLAEDWANSPGLQPPK